MKFENLETEEAYLALYKKYGNFHMNYGYNHTITMDDVIDADVTLSELEEIFNGS